MKLTKAFIEDIRELIRSARATVAQGVDLVQVHTNFEIGRRIVEHEQQGKGRAAYGEEVMKALAVRLAGEFGRGFSLSNLKSMRQFYLQYRNRIGQSVTGQSDSPPSSRPFRLNWTHYVLLLGIKDPNERSFYEIEATQQNWTVRELKRQFDSSLYERLALSRDKKPRPSKAAGEYQGAKMKTQTPSARSAKGAGSMQPRATPWDWNAPARKGPKARSNRPAFGAGFQPLWFAGPLSQGVALGWDKVGALPLRIAATATLKAGFKELLGIIAALL